VAIVFPIAGPAIADELPDATRLVRAVCADEYKIHNVQSLYVRLKVKWFRTAEAILQSRAELQAQNPGVPATDFTPERFSELRSERSIGELERAFDAKRLRFFDHLGNDIDLKIWDGKTATFYQKHEAFKSEAYSYGDNPKQFFGDNFFDGLTFLRLGRHSFWWNSVAAPTAAERALCFGKRPEDYKCVGTRRCRGRECYVLECRKQGRNQLFVDVKDHRLRGILDFYLPNDLDRAKALELVRRISGRKSATEAELVDWLKSLPAETGRRVQCQIEDAVLQELGQPFSHFFADDYREVAPGFWFPMLQGYVSFSSKKGRSFEQGRRELQVVEIKVNQPIPDSLFTMEMKEGVRVVDTRGMPKYRCPCLVYTYKKDRSQAEWQAILGAHQKEVDEARKGQAERDRRIGQPAIEFGKSQWLNSKPLKLAELRGKVVVFDFWAAGCGSCRNDLPVMEAYHTGRAGSDIVFIGVHASGNTKEQVQEVVRQYRLTYPIYLDTPTDSRKGGVGAMMSWFAVQGIPYAAVIDREGKVAGHGRLTDVLEKAQQLAYKHK
jgi:thiol-disulfide isomerase/thioredoxin